MAHIQIGRVAHAPPSSELMQYRGNLSPHFLQRPCLFATRASVKTLSACRWHSPHGVNAASTLRCTPFRPHLTCFPQHRFVEMKNVRTCFFPIGGALLFVVLYQRRRRRRRSSKLKTYGNRNRESDWILHKESYFALEGFTNAIVVSRQHGAAYEI
jgi:hypothetical protein